MGLHAVVLLKQILDPELPPSKFQIDAGAKRPVAGIAPEVLGPYESTALEVALQLKDAGVVDKVTALSLGTDATLESLRKALAVKADEAVLVKMDASPSDLEPAQTAAVLAKALQRLGADVVIAGRQAGDWDNGQVGYLLAEALGCPCISFVRRIAADGGQLKVVRDGVGGGSEVVTADTPVVLTVTNDDSTVLRMPRVQDLMKARRQTIEQWTLSDLELSDDALAAASVAELVDLRIPERQSECEFIEGDDPEEVANKLVSRLKELKLL